MENTVSSRDGCFIDFISNILHYIPTDPLSITSSLVPDMDMNREINTGLKCTRLLFDNDRQMFYTGKCTQTRDVFRILS